MNEARVTTRGLAFDRHWMLVDEQGKFVTQRTAPEMSQIKPKLLTNRMSMEMSGMGSIEVPFVASGPRLSAEIWKDTLKVQEVSSSSSEWFSEALHRKLRLVCMPDDVSRQVDPVFAELGDEVGFADGYSFLMLSQASLDDVSERMGSSIDALRFRPNLVIQGVSAFEEDEYRHFSINGVDFRAAKPCARCVIPTIDPETGNKNPKLTKVLAGYRTKENSIMFGQNLIHDGVGILKVGSEVLI